MSSVFWRFYFKQVEMLVQASENVEMILDQMTFHQEWIFIMFAVGIGFGIGFFFMIMKTIVLENI